VKEEKWIEILEKKDSLRNPQYLDPSMKQKNYFTTRRKMDGGIIRVM